MRRISNSALLIAFAAVVVTLLMLAVLQYGWIMQASALEQRRLEEMLRNAAGRFSEDFRGELSRLVAPFWLREMPAEEQLQQLLAQRQQQWLQVSWFPELLRDVFIARIDG